MCNGLSDLISWSAVKITQSVLTCISKQLSSDICIYFVYCVIQNRVIFFWDTAWHWKLFYLLFLVHIRNIFSTRIWCIIFNRILLWLIIIVKTEKALQVVRRYFSKKNKFSMWVGKNICRRSCNFFLVYNNDFY